jgi:hypothetical protein
MLNKTLTLILAGFLGLAAFGNALADLNDGLVAYYPFDGNAEDASGNGNHGTVYGATLTEDRLGNADSAYSFNNNSIRVPSSKSLESPAITTSVWVRNFGSPGRKRYILSKGAYNCHYSSYAIYTNEGGLSFYVVDGDFSWVSPQVEASIWDGEWHHVVGVFVNNTIQLYVDGVEVLADSSTKHPIANTSKLPTVEPINYELPSSDDLYIGVYGGTCPNHFNGDIDEVRIYNRALSESEIKELYGETPQEQECEKATHASYDSGKLSIPFVEVPLFNLYTHQPTGEIAVFSTEFRQMTQSLDFNLLSYRTKLVFLTEKPNPCHAVYDETQKTLHIPFVDIGSEVYEVEFQHLKSHSIEFGKFHLESYNLVK